MKNRLFFSFILLLMLTATMSANSQETSCQEWIAALKARQGRVETQQNKKIFWLTAELEDTYCFGDKIRTFQRSRATVLLRDKSYLRLNQNTITRFPEYKNKEELSFIDLIKGAIFFRSRVPRRLEVETPFVNAVIKGTEFLVIVDKEKTQVTVFKGVVETTNKYGQLTLNKGETAITKINQPPQRHILVKPNNAVQWALYYPPVIDFQILAEDFVASHLESALDAYQQGDLPAAFNVLDSLPENQRSHSYLTLKSALLLTVGRVDEAQSYIARVLTKNPDNANAMALKSIIAVAHNDNEQAIAIAQKAVRTNPQSAPALIALSYAHQAQFELEAARISLKKAVTLAPNDALAWARLAELQLSLGDLDSALEAAEKAVSLNPNLERTQSVLGFAALTRMDIDKAKVAFDKAIRFDPAAPLPRLGLGLVKIRQGNLNEGTDNMEIAASLDPDNSLIRSYLGKAFYEKKDKHWASKELAMAKELDPKDPTPWFYDAILKQTTNRPVEALHNMQKAIELNDNRAIYRSRLLLDDDLAARSASLGRIYNDLGFQQLGLLEGWKSVSTDPSNYSAHRLLADNYAALPRHEIARVSELLQAQLLQPMNVTPVQPQLAESNLLILDGLGPTNLSFNEFNPLFVRNRLALQASGIVGSNETYSDEVTQSGLWDKFSYSLGQFHYETDGFRKNNALESDIYNAFIQGNISPKINLQIEYRHKKTKHGDLSHKFNLDEVDDDFKRNVRTDSFRGGIRFSPTLNSDFIASIIYQNKNEMVNYRFFDDTTKSNGYITEIQNLFRTSHLNLTIGGGYYDVTDNINRSTSNNINSSAFSIQHSNGYLYSYTRYPNQIVWTIAISFDSLRDERLGKFNLINPKFGMVWDLTSNTTIRFAAFRTLKRTLIANQTIEPTQIAGFNQFFDDFNGTESRRYGVAVDHKFYTHFSGGIEYSRRYLKKAIRRGELNIFNQREDFYRTYLYWTPLSSVAVGISYQLDYFGSEGQFTGTPKTKTQIAPLTFHYFHPSGFIGQFGITYINQKMDFKTITAMKNKQHDKFMLMNLGIGYKLPKRYGTVSFKVSNIFDQKFNFLDFSNRNSIDEYNPLFIPERTASAQVTLAF